MNFNIYSKKTIEKIERKVNFLGINAKWDVFTFLNIRLVTSILLFIFMFNSFNFILGIVFVILYYYLFEKILLDEKIKKRTLKLNVEAIYFFEVLTLSL